MQVRVRLFAAFRERAKASELTYELPEGATAASVLDRLVAEHPDLAGLARSVQYAVDQEFVSGDHPLRNGSEIAFIPPVSGGEESPVGAPPRRLFKVTADPIDVDAVTRHVMDDERDGAVVTFVGIARRFARGRRVSYLEYEAYPEMAEKSLAQIADEMRQKWRVENVAIVHRVGRLAIGDVSIAIAVGSPHRKEAFQACSYAIDRVKEHTPVWKKEVWEDGSEWIGREGG